MSNNKKPIILSGIVKQRNNHIGFRVGFDDIETANHYKDMLRHIIKSDKHKIIYKTGYYDIYKPDGGLKHGSIKNTI